MSRFNLRPCPKLNPRYYGPYKVLAQPGVNRYKLQLPDDCYIHDTFSSDRLKPYHDPSMVKFKGKSLPLDAKFTGDADDADDVEYEIDKILDWDVMRKEIWYLVAWKGYDEVHESTWESRKRLVKDARKIVLKYDSENGVTTVGGSRAKRKKLVK